MVHRLVDLGALFVCLQEKIKLLCTILLVNETSGLDIGKLSFGNDFVPYVLQFSRGFVCLVCAVTCVSGVVGEVFNVFDE